MPRLTDVLTHSIVLQVKFAKIQFDTPEVSARALRGLMVRGRVTVLRDHVMIVPEPALDWLRSESLSYRLLSLLNQDDVVQTLRDNLADPVQ